MSSVRIKGDTSGYVDLTASVTGGNLTVGNGTNNPLFIDAANDRVGFGTASPSTPLDVTKAGGGNFVATFQNTTTATPYGVWIKDAPSGANAYPLLTVVDDAGSQTYFRVDSGTGYVTAPKQPAFLAGGLVGSGGTSTASPMVLAAQLNIGGHYNASNGRFTAPISGTYRISLTGLKQGTTPGNINLQVNGVSIYRTYGSPTSDTVFSLVANVALNLGDYVQIAPTSVTYYLDYTQFSGYLIG